MSWWIAGAAAVGAIADRKKPLRGAAIGAGLMATGGAAAGAMGGGAAAAGAGGAAAGGAAAGTGATAAGTTAAGTGAAGGGLLGGTAAAGTAAPAAAGTAAPSTGLLGSINSTLTQYKPAIDAAGMGVQMSGLLDQRPPEAQAPVPEQMQGGSQTLATISAQGAPAAVQAGMQERARRRAMLRGGV